MWDLHFSSQVPGHPFCYPEDIHAVWGKVKAKVIGDSKASGGSLSKTAPKRIGKECDEQHPLGARSKRQVR